jgi:hypothetical protein
MTIQPGNAQEERQAAMVIQPESSDTLLAALLAADRAALDESRQLLERVASA